MTMGELAGGDRLRRSWTLRLLAVVLTALAVGACAAGVPVAKSADEAAVETAFVGVTVLSMEEGAAPLRDYTVVTAGDRITRMGPAKEVAAPAGAQVIDGAGKYLMPGLADMHVHLEYFEQPDVLRLFLANGVTTVRNMDGRPYILDWRREVAAGRLAGPTIVTAGPLLDGDPPILPDNTVVRSAAEAEAEVSRQAAAGYDFVKIYTNLSPEAYRAVLATARAKGMPVAGHVPRRVDLADALTDGLTSIEHLADYGDWLEADDSPFLQGWHWSKLYLAMPIGPAKLRDAARRIAASGVWTVPTLVQAERAIATEETVDRWLASPEAAFVPPEFQSQWRARVTRPAARMDESDWAIVARGHQNRRALVGALHAAGARMAAGTDTPNPFVVPGYALLDELALLIQSGLRPLDALAAATREAAALVGQEEEWGTVAAGRRADLLLLDADPLADMGNLHRRAGVMTRGRWMSESDLQAGLAAPLAVR